MSDPALTPAWLRNDGFDGFISIANIRSRVSPVPADPGVYVVYRQDLSPPEFLGKSTGGWHKGRDPSVPTEELGAKWVGDAHVLYVGKADAGQSGTRGIRVRLDEYLRFGRGEPIGHWGGRYLWQLAGTDSLHVCWKACSRPTEEEGRLLSLFRRQFGVLPFANLRGGSTSRETG